MKISRSWLQTYFENPLPDVVVLSDALTFHAFEIERIEGDILDVKVTPNRGHDCLSHRGIAKELSAIFNIPMKKDPLRLRPNLNPTITAVSVSIENPELCPRYIAGYIKGIKVGPSPEWLQKALESLGQRSINNIVDATNYIMFDLGQPLHAFDAGKLAVKDGKYAIAVRGAQKGEMMLALDDKEYALNETMLVIADANANATIGIAGVKGGKPSGVDEMTTDIIIESANFDGVSVRKTAHALKLRTDASTRFEQAISPELAAYGLRAAADLIGQLAGGEIVGFVDEYPRPAEKRAVSVSLKEINYILGTACTEPDVADTLKRLDLPHAVNSEMTSHCFVVQVPFERLDILIAEDLVEEVGRIIGYDKIDATELAPFSKQPEVNTNFYAAEKIREDLMTKGYSEICTSVFADTGERAVANKVDSVHPFLRSNLIDGLNKALERNVHNKDLLGLKEVKLFEIGTVWRDGKELMMVGTAGEKEKAVEKLLEGIDSTTYEDLPLSQLARYQPFSRYPFIVRDIAMWTEKGTQTEDVLTILRATARAWLVRSEMFDRFEKGEKLSLAFHLVFQSFEKTLTDEEVNAIMESVYKVVAEKGWQVR